MPSAEMDPALPLGAHGFWPGFVTAQQAVSPY